MENKKQVQTSSLQLLQEIKIAAGIMRVDTKTQNIDMLEIENRRFLFHPDTGLLVLGRQYGRTSGLPGSHAEELADAGETTNYDSFVRGWIGTGSKYPYGVIHFAPNVETNNPERYERAFQTLEMFYENGAKPQTMIRGFGKQWEQPLSSIITERICC